MTIKYSLIIPIYMNEDNIPDLINAIDGIHHTLGKQFEAVFVVDGSPDNSYRALEERLKNESFCSKLLLLSRNFGSFSAIKAGLDAADGEYSCVMAADLQEPPELAVKIFKTLECENHDIVVGKRISRKDPSLSKLFSSSFWWFYRKLIMNEIPKGGVDIFGCNLIFKNQILDMKESHSSLIGQIYWLGFRRKEIGYERRERLVGKSSWSFKKKVQYMLDSIYAFTDIPIKLITFLGFLGVLIFGSIGTLTVIARLIGVISLPGYSTLIVIIGFFGSINLLALGVVGSYSWRTYENTKKRVGFVVMKRDFFGEYK